MLCRMPAVRLPDNLKEELHQSVSGQINNTEGPGVAVYLSSDGNTRADIYHVRQKKLPCFIFTISLSNLPLF